MKKRAAYGCTALADAKSFWRASHYLALGLGMSAAILITAFPATAGVLGKIPVPLTSSHAVSTISAPVTPPPQPYAEQPASALIWSPEVLNGADRERYIKIFALQKRSEWKQADKLANELGDKRLMAYVQMDRYLNPRYKAKYPELKTWMASNSSIPGADKVYALAMKRKARKAAATVRPQAQIFRQSPNSSYAVDEGDVPPSPGFARIDAQVRTIVREQKAVDAEAFLNGASTRNSISSSEYDRAMERVAASYFVENDNEHAYQVADTISRRNARIVPLSDWYAGLAAWRLERYSDAARHFERLARSKTASGASRAAGGFWAARAYLADKQPDQVAEMLELAADRGATFYGLLAARQLGRDLTFQWIEPKLERANYEALVVDPAVARAVALSQIGRRDLAEQELVRAHGWLDPGLDTGLLALAATFRLPAVELQVASGSRLPVSSVSDGRIILNAGLYPIPDYQPRDGFRVDRALVFAFMRQESKFRPDVTSVSGARGLMQLMPRTASIVSKDDTLGRDNDRLLDPSYNLTIAQQYLETLMGSGEPRGNLFMLTTAYNGGPGNLSRWLGSMNFKGDPLLFIESIPASETRGYIERVLTNFWIYRSRLGQSLHSLDASASGSWPVYEAADTSRGAF